MSYRFLALAAVALLTAGCQTISDAPERGRQLRWSGHAWAVKDEPSPVGPGPNAFSGRWKDVFVDWRGRLHLRLVRRRGHWLSTEIASFESFGYGTYSFEVAGGATAIPGNAVLGLFTYDRDPEDAHREIDIELSRWNDGRADNLQCAIQPAEGDLIHHLPLAESRRGWTMSFRWAPGRVDCLITERPAAPGAPPRIVARHAFTRGVPRPGNEKVRLNLWLYQGSPPDTGAPAEVIVRRFRFTPLEAEGAAASDR